MESLILKGWDNGMIMRNKKRKLRSGQGGGKRSKRVEYLGSQVKNVFPNRDPGQL